MDPSFDLPDSTDWISTSLPLFESLEAALRCEVCKEFYDGPVITACSHTFCSICIRRCITNDGKCPACKQAVQADKLLPNIAIREIVNRFQVTREDALELARRDKEELRVAENGGKKRKLDDTDLEDEDVGRQTRSRTTRSSQRSNGAREPRIEIPDSEDEGDAYVPEGLVPCPLCMKAMKEVQIWTHMETDCPKAQSSAPASRSRTKSKVMNPLQRRQKNESPAPARLPQLTYALLRETQLRDKLKELGIPASGKKDLLIRRHTEWLHLWNSNCDSDQVKTKRELLKELDVWERTQGGNARVVENKVMKKDYDGKAHADTHKSQFDELIANARRERAALKKKIAEDQIEGVQPTGTEGQNPEPPHPKPPAIVEAVNPYEGNDSALAIIREKVEEANRGGNILQSLEQHTSTSDLNTEAEPKVGHRAHSISSGIANPLGSPSRKMPMFTLPEDPVVDIDATSTH
ncbi:DNA repair protein rad18 [Amniculicola lignicola CBS 123094]|uniref:Postreplication repair E3 ubiquitin-protein ligase RAD18 n=1 Tax=Amniculicola lignicola CBS 123094 TaxID=1392246 RepID=A0A6A5W0Q9_9PLEO|nr:DNA repair protein rad18 [Amniculicola lignicola CBS 123094]